MVVSLGKASAHKEPYKYHPAGIGYNDYLQLVQTGLILIQAFLYIGPCSNTSQLDPT